jgi:hypothetical protein
MAALFREEVPPDHAVLEMLAEANEFVVVGVQILRILVTAPVVLGRLVGGQFIPLLAGDLTAAARGAAGRIYKE